MLFLALFLKLDLLILKYFSRKLIFIVTKLKLKNVYPISAIKKLIVSEGRYKSFPVLDRIIFLSGMFFALLVKHYEYLTLLCS